MHEDGTMLFQQLSYNKEEKTLLTHSLMTICGTPNLYERVTTWSDGGKRCSETIGITLYSPDPPFQARGSVVQNFFRTKAMATVGGGEGVTMVPSWNVPGQIMSNGGGMYWTLEQHLQSPMFLRLFRRGWCSRELELELSVTLDHHIPVHGADVTWAKVTRATRMNVWGTGMAYAWPYTSIFGPYTSIFPPNGVNRRRMTRIAYPPVLEDTWANENAEEDTAVSRPTPPDITRIQEAIIAGTLAPASYRRIPADIVRIQGASIAEAPTSELTGTAAYLADIEEVDWGWTHSITTCRKVERDKVLTAEVTDLADDIQNIYACGTWLAK